MKYTLIPGESCTASEEETMSMIRSVLTEDTTTAKSKKRRAAKATVAMQSEAEPEADNAAQSEDTAPRSEPAAQERAFVERTTEETPRRRATDLPELEAAAAVAARPGLVARARAALARPLSGIIGRVRGFQPTTRHLALASAALLFVLRPHWFVIGLVLALLLVIGTFMVLGADRIWHGVLAWLDRVEGRDPARAAELRAKLDSFACRWDGVLDLFPDGMVDSLYMPDFQAMKQADADHDAVVSDRLNRMVQEG